MYSIVRFFQEKKLKQGVQYGAHILPGVNVNHLQELTVPPQLFDQDRAPFCKHHGDIVDA